MFLCVWITFMMETSLVFRLLPCLYGKISCSCLKQLKNNDLEKYL